jgi:hypothetical protein
MTDRSEIPVLETLRKDPLLFEDVHINGTGGSNYFLMSYGGSKEERWVLKGIYSPFLIDSGVET